MSKYRIIKVVDDSVRIYKVQKLMNFYLFKAWIWKGEYGTKELAKERIEYLRNKKLITYTE